MKVTYTHIEQGIMDIKAQQTDQHGRHEVMDRRLTDYMINEAKS